MQTTVFNTPIVTALLSTLARLIVKVCGWKIEGQKPGCCRYVMIGASHTSHRDFLIFMAIALNMRSPIYWLGNSAWFWGPLRPIMRYLGGIPVTSLQEDHLISKATSAFSCHDRLALAIAPQESCSKTTLWKTSFWHIAHSAKIPVIPGYIDYDRKVAGLGPAYRTTGNKDQDIANLQTFYASCHRYSTKNRSDIAHST